jgi:hypothetical protein
LVRRFDDTDYSGDLRGVVRAPTRTGDLAGAIELGHASIAHRSRISDVTTASLFLAIAILTLLRFILAASLPLSFDESYYWLWSKHLALGYYEHPALIALAIRAGTLIFDDTQFGVRFVPLTASLVASWAVWRSAAVWFSSERLGASACLLFNATLMIAAETMGATPDALLIAAAALLLWTVAKLDSTQDGRWWLAAGAAAGIAIAAKYTGFFLCCSLALWLCASPAGRPWLRTIWPYAGASIALALFAPTIIWNATHGFVSFQFQFGRLGVSHPNAPYLLEFLDGQIALASPCILVLAAFGLVRNSPLAKPARLLGFAAANVWPALLYFPFHSLHDRVQGNWPCFVYPAVALLAAQALSGLCGNTLSGKVVQVSRILALPVAAAILTVAYAQAFFGVLPLGRRDPIARMTAIGFRPVAERISMQALNGHVGAIITTNYATASWIAFYAAPSVPVVELASGCRFSSSPHVTPALLRGRLLYVTPAPEREMIQVRDHFSRIAFAGKIPRTRNGIAIDAYYLYTVSGYHGAVAGRVP